jgi:hypothetical protein
MEPDVAKPAGNLQPQSDGLSSIISRWSLTY